MKDRREKGLCYHCDKKYTRGHICKNPRLFLIDGCWPETEIEMTNEVTDGVVEIEQESSPEISLHAIIGTNTPQTMRVVGTVFNKSISLLIDSGSTHNFVDPQVVSCLRLHINAGSKLQI